MNAESRHCYARKGETVTCENGHYIARMARDAWEHEPVSRDMLCEWAPDAEPERHRSYRACVCPTCGKLWMRAVGLDLVLHVDGAYRTQHPQLLAQAIAADSSSP